MSEQQTGKIYAALASIMREVPAIGKDSRNQAQGFNFRSIDTIYAELHHLFVKHNVVCVPVGAVSKIDERIKQDGKGTRFASIVFTWHLMADDGSYKEMSMIGEGADSMDKACSKAASIAHKYALLHMFLIPTEDMKDPDYDSPDIGQPEKQPEFTGPNHEALYGEFLEKFINPDHFLEAMKFKGELPKQAKNFWAMSDATAAKFVGRIKDIEEAIKEYTNHQPNKQ